MAYFNFSDLIHKYSREFKVITYSGGKYNDMGDWEEGVPSEKILSGAIIGMTESKIYRSDGNLTAQDKVLHMLEPLDADLIDGTVVFNGNQYNIETQKSKENAQFTGVFSYTLKWVSTFD